MHAFERRRYRECIGRIGVEKSCTLHDQERAQTLAAVEHAVAHCREEFGRPRDFALSSPLVKQPVEKRFDFSRTRGKHRFKIESIGGGHRGRAFTAIHYPVKRTASSNACRCTRLPARLLPIGGAE